MTNFALRTTVAGILLASSALPSFAQNFCGGFGAGGQWIGGSPAASDIAVSGSYFEQLTLIPLNSEYVSVFSVTSPTEVRIEAAGQSGGDTVIALYDQTGQLIREDDDGGGDASSRAEVFLDPGTYCLNTRSFGGDVLMTNVRVGRVEHDTLTAGDPNASGAQCDATTQAYPLSNGPIDGQLSNGVSIINSAAAAPYYRFSLASPTSISLTASNENADPVLYLFDNDGYLLYENDDFSGLNARIDVAETLPAGDYCVGVRALSDDTAPITLDLTQYSEEEVMGSMYDNAEASPPMDGSYPITYLGTISGRQRLDVRVGGPAAWYSFDVTESGLILAEAIAVGGSDPLLVLFDDVGRELGYNDDVGGSFDSLIATRVFPGTYMIAVTQPGGVTSAPGTVRLLLERYVPAR